MALFTFPTLCKENADQFQERDKRLKNDDCCFDNCFHPFAPTGARFPSHRLYTACQAGFHLVLVVDKTRSSRGTDPPPRVNQPGLRFRTASRNPCCSHQHRATLHLLSTENYKFNSREFNKLKAIKNPTGEVGFFLHCGWWPQQSAVYPPLTFIV